MVEQCLFLEMLDHDTSISQCKFIKNRASVEGGALFQKKVH